MNIGNLILLEGKINGEAGQLSYVDKIPYYQKSQYVWIEKFIEMNKNWDERMIDGRVVELATVYYKEILKRELPKDKMIQAGIII